MSFTVRAQCANSGRAIKIAIDSELKISKVTNGSTPMFCVPIVALAKTQSPSIVDVF